MNWSFFQDLWTTHNEFEINLKATKASPTLTIPDCFISNKEKFLFYGEFCSNLTPSQELIDKLCLTAPNVQQKIQVCVELIELIHPGEC